MMEGTPQFGDEQFGDDVPSCGAVAGREPGADEPGDAPVSPSGAATPDDLGWFADGFRSPGLPVGAESAGLVVWSPPGDVWAASGLERAQSPRAVVAASFESPMICMVSSVGGATRADGACSTREPCRVRGGVFRTRQRKAPGRLLAAINIVASDEPAAPAT